MCVMHPTMLHLLICISQHVLSCRLAAVRTNIVADASSGAEPLVQHMNADGETVATAGEQEGYDGGPHVSDAPADLGTCDPKYWSCPGAAGYRVRGQTYLKVQQASLSRHRQLSKPSAGHVMCHMACNVAT